ncbi:MAG: SGNH/GDSL hydrolase family protein [Clostridia bacterium]|nr:SGNH/GDSL hydrolase family protein [Clostridia bacterium]
MKADLDLIKKITVGAVRIWEAPDGVHFSRFTEEEEAGWYSCTKVLGDRSRSLCGIRLDFLTDADEVAFMLSYGNSVDVWLNGVYNRSLKFADIREAGESEVRIPLVDQLGTPNAETRVTLWFPCHAGGVLGFLDAVGATYIRPLEYRHRILFLGDSITQGWNSARESMSFASRVTRFYDADTLNCSVGGGYFSTATIGENGFKPDAITIAYGTNDFTRSQSPEELQGNCTAYLDKVKALYPNVPIFVITPIIRHDNAERKAGTFDWVRKTIAAEAGARGMNVIDGFSLFPTDEYYFWDSVHPKEAGFAEYALALIPQLQKVLKW